MNRDRNTPKHPNSLEFEVLAKDLIKREVGGTFKVKDIQLVWFTKNLSNRKAMFYVETQGLGNLNSLYVEVTYDGTREVMYMDVYTKFTHSEFQHDGSYFPKDVDEEYVEPVGTI